MMKHPLSKEDIMSKIRRISVGIISVIALFCTVLAFASCSVGNNESNRPSVDKDGNCTVHDWIAASCEKPKTCRACGITDGTALGHTGGYATCTTRARCDVCHASYGTVDKTKCRGGSATCTELAVCDVCGESYGTYSDVHTASEEWVKLPGGKHYSKYSCCENPASEPVSHSLTEGNCPFCGYNPQIPTESKTAAQGAKGVTISLSVKDNPGITGMQIKIEYNDTYLHLVEVSAGDAMKNHVFTAPETLKSGVSVMFDTVSVEEKDIFDGEVVTLTFDIDENAPAVDFQITFSIVAVDNNLEPINFKAANAAITVDAKTTGGAEQ